MFHLIIQKPLSSTGVKYDRREQIFEWMILGNHYIYKNFEKDCHTKEKRILI